MKICSKNKQPFPCRKAKEGLQPDKKLRNICESSVGKHLPVSSRYQLPAEGLAAEHLPRRHHHTQGAAETFLYNSRDLAFGYGDLVVSKVSADILPVKKQVVRQPLQRKIRCIGT